MTEPWIEKESTVEELTEMGVMGFCIVSKEYWPVSELNYDKVFDRYYRKDQVRKYVEIRKI